MSLEMLLKVNESQYIQLIEYVKKLVFKDQILADLNENRASIEQSTIFINAVLASNTNSINNYLNNTRTLYNILKNYETIEAALKAGENVPAYAERNKYYRDLFVEKEVNIYLARLANDFDMIYSPANVIDEKTSSIYNTEYVSQLVYFLKVMYTDAYAGNENYRAFVRFMVAYMTLERTLDIMRGPPALNIELMDNYAIKNLLYSFGITFLDQLTISYQRLVLRNLNEILKYKGTARVFKSIFKIFGFENVEAFKYYILKDYERDQLNQPDYSTTELKFLRLPFDEQNPESYISKISYEEQQQLMYEYSSVVAGDRTWKITKEIVEEQQFNLLNTKYFDITSAIDIMAYTLQIVYFFNTLMEIRENYEETEDLNFFSSEIGSAGISLLDGMLGLSVLSMSLLGFIDNIPKAPNEVERVYSFNKHADLSKLSKSFYLNFDISRVNKLVDISTNIDVDTLNLHFNSNNDLREDLKAKITSTTSYTEYTELMKDYEILYISDLMTTKFANYSNYLQYLEINNPVLADFVKKAVEDDTGDLLNIRQAFSVLAGAIENFIDNANIRPSVLNITYILEFARKMINAFKAYTIQLKDLSIFYQINDPFEDLKMLDRLKFEGEISVSSTFTFEDYVKLRSTLNFEELLDLSKSIYSIRSIVNFNDTIDINDLVDNLVKSIKVSTPFNLNDNYHYNSVLNITNTDIIGLEDTFEIQQLNN